MTPHCNDIPYSERPFHVFDHHPNRASTGMVITNWPIEMPILFVALLVNSVPTQTAYPNMEPIISIMSIPVRIRLSQNPYLDRNNVGSSTCLISTHAFLSSRLYCPTYVQKSFILEVSTWFCRQAIRLCGLFRRHFTSASSFVTR